MCVCAGEITITDIALTLAHLAYLCIRFVSYCLELHLVGCRCGWVNPRTMTKRGADEDETALLHVIEEEPLTPQRNRMIYAHHVIAKREGLSPGSSTMPRPEAMAEAQTPSAATASPASSDYTPVCGTPLMTNMSNMCLASVVALAVGAEATTGITRGGQPAIVSTAGGRSTFEFPPTGFEFPPTFGGV